MAITQDRMIALLEDFAAARAQISSLRKELVQIVKWANEGMPGYDTGVGVAASVSVALQTHPEPTSEVFAVERAHFARVAKSNTRVRNYLYAKRRAAGVPMQQWPRDLGGAIESAQEAVPQEMREVPRVPPQSAQPMARMQTAQSPQSIPPLDDATKLRIAEAARAWDQEQSAAQRAKTFTYKDAQGKTVEYVVEEDADPLAGMANAKSLLA